MIVFEPIVGKQLQHYRLVAQVAQINFKNIDLSSTVLAVFGARLVVGVVHAIYCITAPHKWRQIDTMGVALRYGLRWSVESSDLPWWVPAIINHGDTSGLTAMEFPVLNMLGGAAFFIAGQNPDLGRTLAQLFELILVGSLVWLSHFVWRHAEDRPPHMLNAVLLSPILSFSALFTNKFMPDLPAFLLVLCGLGLLWRKSWIAPLFIALGLLMKPTAIVTLLLGLLDPNASKKWRAIFPMLCLAAIPPGIWYGMITPWLQANTPGAATFVLHGQVQPLLGILTFWTGLGILEVFQFHMWFQGALILVPIWFWMTRKTAKDAWPLWWKMAGVLFLQGSLVGALSADHSERHAYYLIGLSTTAILLMLHMCSQPRTHWIRIAFILGMTARVGEASYGDLAGIWHPDAAAKLWSECRLIRKEHPEAGWHRGKVFRTTSEESPLLPLCLGERGESEVAEWGLTYRDHPLPSGCREVQTTQHLVLFRCQT